MKWEDNLRPNDAPGGADRWWPHRESSRFLAKVRLCDHQHTKSGCRYLTGASGTCSFAHTLEELSVPPKGDGRSWRWSRVWEEGRVHRWFGQHSPPKEQELFKVYFQNERVKQPAQIPPWAIAYAICHGNHAPQWLPPKSDWGLQDDIDHLKAARGGRLPPGVPDCLSKENKEKLERAWWKLHSNSKSWGWASHRSWEAAGQVPNWPEPDASHWARFI